MKKIIIYLISLLTVFMFIPSVYAASGSVSISSTNQVVVGNKVTVTVTISSGVNIGSWQMNLNYDKDFLQLTSSNAEAGGTMMAASSATGVKSKSYTFTFKTLKTGSTKLSIGSSLAYAFDDLSQLKLSNGTKSIKIITQAELEASYSKNNNLKSLGIDGFEITPEFNENTLEYSVIVPENTKSININGQVADGKSTVTGIGTKEVSSGNNKFTIVVRAQNGSEKTYTINVDVKDSNPIEAYVEGKLYTVVKIKEYLPEMISYEESTIKINEFDIPAYHSNLTGFTLVGLKDSEGAISLFTYQNDKYEKYTEVTSDNLSIYPLDTNEELNGFEKKEVIIKDVKINGYIKNNDNFITFYGINVLNGEKGFFTYDKKNNSIIAFDDTILKVMDEYQEKINLYSYIIIGFSGILLIMILILLTRKPKKKNKKEEKVYEENILEESKAKKKNKKNNNAE